MTRGFRLLLFGVLGIVGLAIAGMLVLVRIGAVEYTSDDALLLQVRNLQQAVAGLESIPNGRDPLLSVGISDLGLQELTAALVGTVVEFPSLANSRITLSELSIQTDPGELRLSLRLTGTSPDIRGEVALAGTGSILFDHFEGSPDGSALQAVYQVHIERLAPEFRLSWLSLHTRRWANELLRSQAMEEFAELLQFKIPIPVMPEIALGFVKEDTTFVEDTGANYVIRSELPDSKLSWPVTVRAPIPASDGLHIIADSPQVAAEQPQPPAASGSAAELTAERDKLLQKVRMLTERLPRLSAAVELNVHRLLFEQLVAQVNALPHSSRTVSYQLVSSRGRLVEEMHDAGILGKGGYYIEFDGQNSASGAVRIGDLASEWSNQGLTLTAKITADAGARLNVYIDPYIGGGLDFDMGINGAAEALISIQLDARAVSAGDYRAFMMGPVLRCTQFPMTIQGGGSVKFGVEMYSLVGEEPSRPTILITNAPQRYPLINEVDTRQIRHGASYLEAVLVPESVDVSATAYRFRADLKAVRRAGAIPAEAPLSGLSEAAESALEIEWMRQVAPSCPAKSESKFLFAGQDFGPNNEIVKALQAIARSVDLTKHNLKVAWNDVEIVGRDPRKAPAKAVEILGRAGQEAERMGHKFDEKVIQPGRKLVRKLTRKIKF